MRHALIIAGGSGTRLWPMSKGEQPKQLIPFIRGRSLLRIAVDRLDGLVPEQQQHICAGTKHREAIREALGGWPAERYIGEPTGRDTLNAVGLPAAVIAKSDPDAVIAVFTADHIIEPVPAFQKIVDAGFQIAEQHPDTLVTFGIEPTEAATGFGYLELGEPIESAPGEARLVSEFKEKPDEATAKRYLDAGPQRYLWNSGMFVWRASTVLDCIRRFAPENYDGLMKIAGTWGTPEQDATLEAVYPTLKKISVDFAIMEPASKDGKVRVAAAPMPLTWLDVGSWPSYAETCETDEQGNALGCDRHVLMDTRGTLAASSDPDHVITTIGVEGLIIVHTPHATLVCSADRAQDIKELHKRVGEQVGEQWV